jgi:hypothetical protein
MSTRRIVLFLSAVIVSDVLANDEHRHPAFEVLPLGHVEMSVFRTTLEPHVNEIVDRLYAHLTDQRDWLSDYWRKNGDFKPGEGLPYHENFGITEEEYQTFLTGRLTVPIRRLALAFSIEEDIYTITALEGDEIGVIRIDMKTVTVSTQFGLTAECKMGYPDIDSSDAHVTGWYGATCIDNDGSQSDGNETSLLFSIGKTTENRLLINYQAKIVENGELIRNINLKLASVDTNWTG